MSRSYTIRSSGVDPVCRIRVHRYTHHVYIYYYFSRAPKIETEKLYNGFRFIKSAASPAINRKNKVSPKAHRRMVESARVVRISFFVSAHDVSDGLVVCRRSQNMPNVAPENQTDYIYIIFILLYKCDTCVWDV